MIWACPRFKDNHITSNKSKQQKITKSIQRQQNFDQRLANWSPFLLIVKDECLCPIFNFLEQYNNLRLMSLSIFSVKNQWYKNGVWWFTKMANRIIGQQSYDSIRVNRRIFSNKFYFIRQQMLYKLYIQSPDVANMIGLFPKTDSSHGYGNPISYQMYRDFQQNSLNSDGSFGMWLVAITAIYVAHIAYSYMLPWYWNKTASCKSGEQQRMRMRDALATSVVQDSIGFQFLEWGFGPHYTFYVRNKLSEGHAHPDDVQAMATSGLRRSNRTVQHYKKFENKKMIASA